MTSPDPAPWMEWQLEAATEILTENTVRKGRGQHHLLCEDIAAIIAKHYAEAQEPQRETLCFFNSVIQPGEPWTDECEQAFRAAMKALPNE